MSLVRFTFEQVAILRQPKLKTLAGSPFFPPSSFDSVSELEVASSGSGANNLREDDEEADFLEGPENSSGSA